MENMHQDTVDLLLRLADEQNLIQHAMDTYKVWIKNYPESIPSHIDPDQVYGVFGYQKLCFKNALVSYPYIETYLDLMVNDESIGHYKLISITAQG